MFKFLLGVIVTLAFVYPDNTKAVLSKAVDATHNIVSGAAQEIQK